MKMYGVAIKYPKLVIALFIIITTVMTSQLGNLRWETDARVYMPKGHPAIQYDEKIEEIFGVKDSLIILIENQEKSVFNIQTLERVRRITEKVSELPGVVANRVIDVASLSTATAFTGTDDALGAVRLLPDGKVSQESIVGLRKKLEEHADIFKGNLISKDGKATMIRAKIKEGLINRYQTYWQIKGIIAAESGESNSGKWGGWESKKWSEDGEGKWVGNDGGGWAKEEGQAIDNGDKFYLAGRPVIEVTSGQHAMEDMRVMIPLLFAVMSLVLFLIFKTGRGILIPLTVMLGAIVWTLGTMSLMNIPLYTISTMIPVILVAVGVGDSVHLLSNYYDKVLENPYRSGGEIVGEIFSYLGRPLVLTSITTAIGFLALLFAEMPPFKVFGVITVVGIFYSWLITVTFAAALLVVMKPKVAGYHSKKRSLRVHDEQDLLTRLLVGMTASIQNNARAMTAVVVVVAAAALAGASHLYVDSSWLSDFSDESEVVQSTKLINRGFDGSVFLNVVVETDEKGGVKSVDLLRKIEGLQMYAENLPYVGDSLSVVDYLKSLNKTLNEMNENFNTLPSKQEEINEALYLYSVSGQPELLDEVVDYDYKTANITISIKTDSTKILKNIISKVKSYASSNIEGDGISVNYAGSANNSYVWADLLIDSQAVALVFSKLAIFIIAVILFGSLKIGAMVVLPVALATTLVAGLMGWFDVAMDVSTALAAGIAIGVGVDYAVHYIYRYLESRRSGLDGRGNVLAAARGAGRTIVFNAVIVTAGFMVLIASQFPPHQKLGVFVVVYMVFSCMMALIVLPLVLNKSQVSNSG